MAEKTSSAIPWLQSEESQSEKKKNWFSQVFDNVGDAVTAAGANFQDVRGSERIGDTTEELMNSKTLSDAEYEALKQRYLSEVAEREDARKRYAQAHQNLVKNDSFFKNIDQMGGTMEGMAAQALGTIGGAALGAVVSPFTAGGSIALGAKGGNALGAILGAHLDARSVALQAQEEVLNNGGTWEQAKQAYNETLKKAYLTTLPETAADIALGSRIGRAALNSNIAKKIAGSTLGKVGSRVLDPAAKIGTAAVSKTKNRAVGALSGLLTDVAWQGLTEAGQEVTQDYIANREVAKALGKQDNEYSLGGFKDYALSDEGLETMKTAGITGALFGGIGGAMSYKQYLGDGYANKTATEIGLNVDNILKEGKDYKEENINKEFLDNYKDIVKDWTGQDTSKMSVGDVVRNYVAEKMNRLGIPYTEERAVYEANRILTNLTSPTGRSDFSNEFSRAVLGNYDIENILDKDRASVEQQQAQQEEAQNAVKETIEKQQEEGQEKTGGTIKNVTQQTAQGLNDTTKFSDKVAQQGTTEPKVGFEKFRQKWSVVPDQYDGPNNETYSVNGRKIRVTKNQTDLSITDIDKPDVTAIKKNEDEAFRFLEDIESGNAKVDKFRFMEDNTAGQSATQKATPSGDGVIAQNNRVAQVHSVKEMLEHAKSLRGTDLEMDDLMVDEIADAMMRYNTEKAGVTFNFQLGKLGENNEIGSSSFGTSNSIDTLRGIQELRRDGVKNAVVNLYMGADAMTAIHELAHIGFWQMSEQDRQRFTSYAIQTEERFIKDILITMNRGELKGIITDEAINSLDRDMLLDILGKKDDKGKLIFDGVLNQVKYLLNYGNLDFRAIDLMPEEQRKEVQACIEERFAWEMGAWYAEGYTKGIEPRNIIERILDRVCRSLGWELGLVSKISEKLKSDGYQNIKHRGKMIKYDARATYENMSLTRSPEEQQEEILALQAPPQTQGLLPQGQQIPLLPEPQHYYTQAQNDRMRETARQFSNATDQEILEAIRNLPAVGPNSIRNALYNEAYKRGLLKDNLLNEMLSQETSNNKNQEFQGQLQNQSDEQILQMLDKITEGSMPTTRRAIYNEAVRRGLVRTPEQEADLQERQNLMNALLRGEQPNKQNTQDQLIDNITREEVENNFINREREKRNYNGQQQNPIGWNSQTNEENNNTYQNIQSTDDALMNRIVNEKSEDTQQQEQKPQNKTQKEAPQEYSDLNKSPEDVLMESMLNSAEPAQENAIAEYLVDHNNGDIGKIKKQLVQTYREAVKKNIPSDKINWLREVGRMAVERARKQDTLLLNAGVRGYANNNLQANTLPFNTQQGMFTNPLQTETDRLRSGSELVDKLNKNKEQEESNKEDKTQGYFYKQIEELTGDSEMIDNYNNQEESVKKHVKKQAPGLIEKLKDLKEWANELQDNNENKQNIINKIDNRLKQLTDIVNEKQNKKEQVKPKEEKQQDKNKPKYKINTQEEMGSVGVPWDTSNIKWEALRHGKFSREISRESALQLFKEATKNNDKNIRNLMQEFFSLYIPVDLQKEIINEQKIQQQGKQTLKKNTLEEMKSVKLPWKFKEFPTSGVFDFGLSQLQDSQKKYWAETLFNRIMIEKNNDGYKKAFSLYTPIKLQNEIVQRFNEIRKNIQKNIEEQDKGLKKELENALFLSTANSNGITDWTKDKKIYTKKIRNMVFRVILNKLNVINHYNNKIRGEKLKTYIRGQFEQDLKEALFVAGDLLGETELDKNGKEVYVIKDKKQRQELTKLYKKYYGKNPTLTDPRLQGQQQEQIKNNNTETTTIENNKQETKQEQPAQEVQQKEQTVEENKEVQGKQEEQVVEEKKTTEEKPTTQKKPATPKITVRNEINGKRIQYTIKSKDDIKEMLKDEFKDDYNNNEKYVDASLSDADDLIKEREFISFNPRKDLKPLTLTTEEKNFYNDVLNDEEYLNKSKENKEKLLKLKEKTEDIFNQRENGIIKETKEAVDIFNRVLDNKEGVYINQLIKKIKDVRQGISRRKNSTKQTDMRDKAFLYQLELTLSKYQENTDKEVTQKVKDDVDKIMEYIVNPFIQDGEESKTYQRYLSYKEKKDARFIPEISKELEKYYEWRQTSASNDVHKYSDKENKRRGILDYINKNLRDQHKQIYKDLFKKSQVKKLSEEEARVLDTFDDLVTGIKGLSEKEREEYFSLVKKEKEEKLSKEELERVELLEDKAIGANFIEEEPKRKPQRNQQYTENQYSDLSEKNGVSVRYMEANHQAKNFPIKTKAQEDMVWKEYLKDFFRLGEKIRVTHFNKDGSKKETRQLTQQEIYDALGWLNKLRRLDKTLKLDLRGNDRLADFMAINKSVMDDFWAKRNNPIYENTFYGKGVYVNMFGEICFWIPTDTEEQFRINDDFRALVEKYGIDKAVQVYGKKLKRTKNEDGVFVFNLKDLVTAPEIFENYPELETQPVRFDPTDIENAYGAYSVGEYQMNNEAFKKRDSVNKRDKEALRNAIQEDLKELTKTFIHETDHSVQDINGQMLSATKDTKGYEKSMKKDGPQALLAMFSNKQNFNEIRARDEQERHFDKNRALSSPNHILEGAMRDFFSPHLIKDDKENRGFIYLERRSGFEQKNPIVPEDYIKNVRNQEASTNQQERVEQAQQILDKAFPNVRFQYAWHSTPHDFNYFTLDHLLKGEGAMAHGWGLYFAKSLPKNYENYFKEFNISDITMHGVKYKDMLDVAFSDRDMSYEAFRRTYRKENEKEVIKELLEIKQEYVKLANSPHTLKKYVKIFKENLNSFDEVISEIKKYGFDKKEEKGRLLFVDIPNDDVLIRERAMFKDQPIKVQREIEKILNTLVLSDEEVNLFKKDNGNIYNKLSNIIYEKCNYDKKQGNFIVADTGEILPIKIKGNYNNYGNGFRLQSTIKKMASQEATSKLLNKYGIKGISYNGRQDGECVVVFDNKAINIVNKFKKEEGKWASVKPPSQKQEFTDTQKQRFERKLQERREQNTTPQNNVRYMAASKNENLTEEEKIALRQQKEQKRANAAGEKNQKEKDKFWARKKDQIARIHHNVYSVSFDKSAQENATNKAMIKHFTEDNKIWKKIENKADNSITFVRKTPLSHHTKEWNYSGINGIQRTERKRAKIIEWWHWFKDKFITKMINDRYALYKLANKLGIPDVYKKLVVLADQSKLAHTAMEDGIVYKNAQGKLVRTKGLNHIIRDVGEENQTSFNDYCIAYRVLDLAHRVKYEREAQYEKDENGFMKLDKDGKPILKKDQYGNTIYDTKVVFEEIKQKMTVEEAEKKIAEIKKNKKLYDLFESNRKAFVEFNHALLQVTLLDGGIINEGQYKAMLAKDPNFVPLEKIMDDEDCGFISTQRASGLVNTQSPYRKIGNSVREVKNPLMVMQQRTAIYYSIAAKNKAGMTFINEIANKVETLANGDKIAQAQGIVRRVSLSERDQKHLLTQPNNRDQIIYVYNNGEKEFYQISDKDIFEALHSMDSEQWNSVSRVLDAIGHTPAALVRATATSTPDFGLRNVIRDTFEAWLTSEHGFIPLIDSLWGMYQFATNSEWAQEYKEVVGEFGTLNREGEGNIVRVGDVLEDKFNPITNTKDYAAKQWKIFQDASKSKQQRVEALDKIMDNAEVVGKKTWAGGKLILSPFVGLYKTNKKLNDMFEQGTRIAEYRNAKMGYNGTMDRLSKGGLLNWNAKLKDAKGSKIEAAHAAKEITLNFEQHGAWGKKLNRYIPFFNASMQGIYKMCNALELTFRGIDGENKPNALLAKEMRVKFAMMVAFAIGAAVAGQGDEDYDEAPEWEKENFWIFPNGIRIPRDQVFGRLVGYTVEHGIDQALKGEFELTDFAWNIAKNFTVEKCMPTLLDMTAGYYGNYDTFRQQPITPEYMADKLGYLQADVSTSNLAQNLSEAMYDILGIDIGAKKIDYAMRMQISNTAKYVKGIYDLGYKAYDPEKFNEKMARGYDKSDATGSLVGALSDVPIFSTFTTNRTTYKSISDFQERYYDLKKLSSDESRMTKEQKREWKRYQDAYKKFKKFQQELKAIKQNNKLSGTEKREKADRIFAKQRKLAEWAER